MALAKRINTVCEEENKVQKTFLQINIGNKENRRGFLLTEIESAAEKINLYQNISIKGIMIIPPPEENKEKYIGYFKKAQKIKTNIEKKIKTCKHLSMGMSGDYIEALKWGTTYVRIGTALFGERQK